MLRAAIDIGSNSVRLLVASVDEDGFKPLFKRLETTRLHEGLGADGALTAGSMDRTAGAVCEFARQAREAGVADAAIAGFATSAVRDAANGDVLIARILRECGVAVRLLSGEEEARYAYFAAAEGGECGVLDIGGASTEMICGVDGHVRAAYSAQLGAVRLRRELGEGADAQRMLERSAELLRPGVERVSPLPARFVGVAGTITTLYAMTIGLAEYDPERIQGGYLSRADVEEWLERLCGMPIDERRRLPGLSHKRAEIIEYGAAILLSFMRLAGLEGISVSDRDNLYSCIMLADE